MDAAYLRSNVSDALSQGLAATLVAQPDDPVEYLGRYLLKYVERKEAEEKTAARAEVLAKESAEAEARANEEQQRDRPKQERLEREEKEALELEELLESSEEIDDDVWRRVLDFLQRKIGATGVYVAKKEPRTAGGGGGGEEEEEEGDAADSQLRYIAASQDHDFMRSCFLDGNQGVTFDAWKPVGGAAGGGGEGEEEEEEELDEDGNPIPKPPPPPPVLPTVQVDNVLLSSRVHFFRLPRFGGFVAVPVRYKSSLHPEAIPEEDAARVGDGDKEEEEGEEEEKEKEDGEEGGEGKEGEGEGEEEEGRPRPIPEPRAKDVDLALCFDTLGRDHRITTEHVQTVEAWAQRLKAALERTERALYEQEVQSQRRLADAEAEARQAVEDAADVVAQVDEEVQQALERVAQVFEERRAQRREALARTKPGGGGEEGEEAEGEGEGEGEGGELPPELAALEHARGGMRKASRKLEHAEVLWRLVWSRRIAPGPEEQKALSAALRLLGYQAEELGDRTARDSKAFHWPTVQRIVRSSEFLNWLAEFDPEAERPGNAVSAEAVRTELEGLLPSVEGEEGGEAGGAASGSLLASLLLEWTAWAVRGLEAAQSKRQREAEEDEQLRAAEEAARARGEEGGEGGEGGEDEEEEED